MYQIVNVAFPFADDVEKGKPHPSLVVTPAFGTYKQFVLAYITTQFDDQMDTDLLLDSQQEYFSKTGLEMNYLIKLHRLITVTPAYISQKIGDLPEELIPELKKKLKTIFAIS
jgi:mRNA-degrading endonuclease toxin of MazEF toxin-antitoxin module